jgi:predicted dehydrogenase
MNQFSVGLVGCGLISEAHLKAWAKTEGFTARGVFDVNRENAEKRAREFGIPTVFSTIDELVAACDVVDVCTPPQTHAAIAEKAIAAGKHLVMEKPMVTDAADWARMAGQIERAGTKIAVIHNLKFLHAVRTAKKWVDEGRIGDVIRIQREFLTSATSDRMLVGDKHWSHKLPGGRWFETLPHELYLTHWFVGALELAGVATLSTDRAPAGAPADEVVITLAGGRTLATIHFSANCEQNRRMFSLQGTEGHITVDLLSDFATITTTKDGKWKRAAGGTILEAGQTLLRGAPDRMRYGMSRVRGESPHSRIIAALAKSLRGEGEEPTPLAEVDYVVRNCEVIGREIDRQVAARRASPGSGLGLGVAAQRA